MADKTQPVDQRTLDREAEEKRQAKVTEAVAKHNAASAAEAAELLRRQGVYETTGIRTVEGKP